MRPVPSSSTTLEQLRVVPYLDVDSLGDRVVNLMPLWDGSQWHLWVPTKDALIEMTPLDAVQVDYVATARAQDSDILIPFVEFMWQRASWPEVFTHVRALGEDFHNLGTSVAKLMHFHATRAEIGNPAISRFVATELEYLVMSARSVFDLLQEIVSEIWTTRIRLLDPEAEKRRKGHKLPDTFSKMVLRKKRGQKTAAEIASDCAIPLPLAEAYNTVAGFFSDLRDTRDAIVHGGSETSTIFETDKGFCVDPKEAMFHRFDCWKQEHYYTDRIASITPWIAHIVTHTIDACSFLMVQMAQHIVFPDPIAPGYHVFVRGPHTEALASTLEVLKGGSPWWGE